MRFQLSESTSLLNAAEKPLSGLHSCPLNQPYKGKRKLCPSYVGDVRSISSLHNLKVNNTTTTSLYVRKTVQLGEIKEEKETKRETVDLLVSYLSFSNLSNAYLTTQKSICN